MNRRSFHQNLREAWKSHHHQVSKVYGQCQIVPVQNGHSPAAIFIHHCIVKLTVSAFAAQHAWRSQCRPGFYAPSTRRCRCYLVLGAVLFRAVWVESSFATLANFGHHVYCSNKRSEFNAS